MQYDTIVIGLGAAGATAASTLAKAGKRVLALEAQDRVGGRVKTVPFGDGIVEEGAEWIQGTVNSKVAETAVEHGIPTIPQVVNYEVYQSDGTKADRDVVDKLITFCSENLASPAHHEEYETFLTRTLKEHLQKKHPELLEDQSFVVKFLEMIAILLNNYVGYEDWDQLSTYSGFEKLEGCQSESWHSNGYKTFFELLLNTYNNGPGLPNLDIELNKEVTNIKWPKDSTGKVEVTCADGDVFTANNVIVTVSLGVLKERYLSLFSPSLPEEKIDIIQNIPMSTLNKIILNFDEVWLPYSSTVGFLWKEEDIKKISKEDEWTTHVTLFSRPMGLETAVTLFITGEVARLVETLSEDIVKTKIMGLLRKFFGKTVTVPEPSGIIRSTWHSNPYTRGSVSYDNIYVEDFSDARSELGEPLVDGSGVPRVLFAGEAMHSSHYGTVHGAAHSGHTEAMRLLYIKKKDC